MTHSEIYLRQTAEVALQIDYLLVDALAESLCQLRQSNGRLFFIGVGGSAANCSHAVNDFRKLAGIEAYNVADNVAELTARTNDEGWDTVFSAWLKVSKANDNDAIFVLSVGGGDTVRNVSPNIVKGLEEAKHRGLRIFGIVGRDGGYTKKVGDLVIVVPTVDAEHVTPHTESFHAVLWHCLVCHPRLIQRPNKWEGLTDSSRP